MAGKFNLVGQGLLSDVSKQMAAKDQYETIYLRPEQIIPNNLNKGFSIEDIEDLMESIQDVGLIDPLVVLKSAEGYRLLSGHRRYTAICRLQKQGKYDSLIPCLNKSLEKIDLPLDSELKEKYILATANAEQRRLTLGDKLRMEQLLSEVYDALHAAGRKIGKRRQFVAEQMGVSDSTVKDLRYVNQHLDEKSKEQIYAGRISITQAKARARENAEEKKPLPKSKQQDAIHEKIEFDNKAVKEIQLLAFRLLESSKEISYIQADQRDWLDAELQKIINQMHTIMEETKKMK